MKLLQTEITPSLNSYLSVLERDDPYFTAPFHSHPEVELVYVKESHGKRIIGDKIEPFEAGDMVFIGSNLPHVWLNDESFYKEDTGIRARSSVLYFNKSIFSSVFYTMSETQKIHDFFARAERGIKIEGKTREIIASKLDAMVHKKDLERIIALLDILHVLSISTDTSYITSEGYAQPVKSANSDRLADVYKYVQANFKEDISLQTVSTIAHLTPQSFCRLFRKRTNRNFVEYLNQVRISNACKYLLETDWTISQIAYNCGYKTVSNFNKIFKDATGLNPKAYRENVEM